jgi:hypothetical protein
MDSNHDGFILTWNITKSLTDTIGTIEIEMAQVPGSAMATLGLKEMGKFLWEGRGKCLRQPNGQTFFPGIWKMQKKTGIIKSGLDAMPLFLLGDLLRVGWGLCLYMGICLFQSLQ